MKTKLSLLAGLVLALFSFGCSSVDKPKVCANAQAVVAAYNAMVAAGVVTPTEDQTRIALAAHAILIAYCGAPGSLAPVAEGAKNLAIGTVPFPRQPKKLFVPNSDGGKTWWYRELPFVIIQDPTGVYQLKGLETMTTGPLYRKAWSTYLYTPDQAWLAGGPGYPTMIPIR